METLKQVDRLKEKMMDFYVRYRETINANDTPRIKEIRDKAIRIFDSIGFPTPKNEEWRNTNVAEVLSLDYNFYFEPVLNGSAQNVFQCNIPYFRTQLIALLNGWYAPGQELLYKNEDGVIMGSFREALKQFPEVTGMYFSKYASIENNGFVALNTAFATDGIFINVPDNTEVRIPIQMINVIRHDSEIFMQTRNLFVVGKNSKVTIVQCEDSYNHEAGFANSVTEFIIGENASVEHYKMQNLNNRSSLINSSFFILEANSRLTAHSITLNGGLIRNDIHVVMEGQGGETEVNGLYLADKNQHIDNQIYIDHASPGCTSREIFKGILDDYARAVFNGHVLVRRDAQHTNAYQSNRNLLLTDKASINTKPFLEIYADDVKCSHGATIGQLDADAMFYLRSRGIGEDNARLLLMYAFAAEVVNRISIEPLRVRIDDMVKKRLRGELSVCDQCVLHCSTQEKPAFDIDVSKI